MVKASHLHTTTRRFTAHGEHQVRESEGHSARSCWQDCGHLSRRRLTAKVLVSGSDRVLGTHTAPTTPPDGRAEVPVECSDELGHAPDCPSF